MTRIRHRAAVWTACLATAAIIAMGVPAEAAGPEAGPQPASAAATATGDFTPPATSATMAYVSGTHLRWSVFDQLGGDGTGSPVGSAVLYGVAGGAVGIVEVGQDVAVHSAATWISTDGGVSWTEHVVAGGPVAFYSVAAHGGVFVALGSNGLYSSADGVAWTPAPTGPHAPRIEAMPATMVAGPQGFVLFARNGTSTATRVWRSRTGAPGSWTAAPYQATVAGFCASSVAMSSSRMVAVGADCAHPSVARVLTSTNGATWKRDVLPAGLRVVGGNLATWPSVSYVASRFLVAGSNTTVTATWVWASTDGVVWRHVSSVTRDKFADVDKITRVMRLGSGWIAVGDRFMDDAVSVWLVAWRTTDLVHWSRYTIAVEPAHPEMAQFVGDATVTGNRLVAVGNARSDADTTAQTWIAQVVP